IDLIEVDAASRTKVEDIREILENVQYLPIQGRFKIYLIDEIHMLSRYSFNSLLKILEEPPNHVKFILATTQKEKIPSTIISRCLSFTLKPLNPKEIYNHIKKILQKENIFFENPAIQLIANKSEGSARDALNLIEQAISIGNGKITHKKTMSMLGMIDHHKIFTLTKALFLHDVPYIFNFLYSFENTEINWDNLLLDISRLIHHFAVLKKFSTHIEQSHYMRCYTEKIKKILETIDISDICSYYKIIILGRKYLPLAPSLKIGFEMTLLNILNSQIQKKIYL
ncbi:DNA polymerase III subunit gamma/tau, partial [Buchnera aphidicola (Hormaphis cornu)]